jgi:hypothetical protein
MAKEQATTKGKDQEYSELLPPENDPRVGYRCFELLSEIIADKDKLGLPQKWTRNYELSRNKHWKQKSDKVPLVTANLLFTHRQRTVNMLTDNNPTFNVTRIGSLDDDKEDLFEKYRRSAEWWWGETEQQNLLEKSIINGETYGCTIEKGLFNPDIEFGMGEVEIKKVDPFYFGMYPVKCEDVQKAEAVLYYYPMSAREARRLWPAKKELIKGDREHLDELGDSRREIQGGRPSEPAGYYATFAGVVKKFINIFRGATGQVDDELLVVETWCRDYTMIPNPAFKEYQDRSEKGEPLPAETKANGAKKEEEPPPEKMPKYKGYIRYVVSCNGGAVVLEDRSNPNVSDMLPVEQAINTYLYDKFPFSLTPSNTDTVIPWGVSDYEQLEGLNIEVDKTLSQMMLWKDKASRLKLINPQNSGVSNDQLTNYPGIIRPSNDIVAKAIRYMDPPLPPADLANTLNVLKDFFYLVSGSFELEAAQVPGREVIAYKAIATLIERASLMLKGKIRNYSRMIRERGRMYISLAQNFYTEERWMSYEENGEEKTFSITGADLIIPARLTVVSGSTMPRSIVQQREEAIGLFEKRAIDAEELLKSMDWPNWKKVIMRMMAGPLAAFLKRLGTMQFPDAMVNLFQKVSAMDDKDFASAVKNGEIPAFPEFLATLTTPGGGGAASPPPPSAADEADARLKDAQARKVEMEIKLVEEQIMTERVDQEVKMHGIHFDTEEQKMRRAELVNKIEERTGKEPGVMPPKTVPRAKQRGTKPYRERGMKTNNQAPPMAGPEEA